MKKPFLLLVFTFLFFSFSTAFAQTGKLDFESQEFNFGSIKQGDVVEYEFKFKNTGDAPLTLTQVKPSCGCTVPDWPREALEPGGDAAIKVKFNSAGKVGRQLKSITVYSTADPDKPIVLRLKGEITAPAIKSEQ